MNPDAFTRTVIYLPKPLYHALERAAAAANETMADDIRARLASSLTVPSRLPTNDMLILDAPRGRV